MVDSASLSRSRSLPPIGVVHRHSEPSGISPPGILDAKGIIKRSSFQPLDPKPQDLDSPARLEGKAPSPLLTSSGSSRHHRLTKLAPLSDCGESSKPEVTAAEARHSLILPTPVSTLPMMALGPLPPAKPATASPPVASSGAASLSPAPKIAPQAPLLPLVAAAPLVAIPPATPSPVLLSSGPPPPSASRPAGLRRPMGRAAALVNEMGALQMAHGGAFPQGARTVDPVHC